MHAAGGAIDVLVENEPEAVATARRLVSYFQSPLVSWKAADQTVLRTAVPEHRRTAYDPRVVLETLADSGSVTELRPEFGRTIVTALARIEGRSVGIFANDSRRLGGAIDSDGADKAARFMALCDARDLPLVSLCDTPGFMVGPKAEETAQIRHFARMFVTGASVTVPFITVVLRKGYGLGAQAMAGGSFHAPLLTLSWPTGEFGGMNLEGAVRLGFRKELEAIEDPADRASAFEAMVAEAYERGKALNLASHFEIDDVIDPAETRMIIADMLRASPPPEPRSGKKRPCVDPW
jgi:acetyl-CoA carboxylase carboxyltransferase component